MYKPCTSIILTFALLNGWGELVFADTAKTPNPSTPDTGSSTTIVKYYQPETGLSTLVYQIRIIKEALEITRPEYGGYELKPYGLARSSKRQAALVSEGKLLNLLSASPGTAIAKADVIPVKIDILRGLLGYRICLVNAARAPDLSNTVDATTLGHVRIGQGLDWSDLDIYKHNNIYPIEGPNLESLYPMLGFHRFDCLALGASEVVFKYHEQQKQFPFLAIEPNLLIYYEFPIYFYVSKQVPELAKRLQIGLTKLEMSGRFSQLFNQYHAQDLTSLNLRARRVICLKSPYINQNDQCTSAIQYPAEL